MSLSVAALPMSGPSGPRPRRRFAPSRILIYAVLVFSALYYLVPLYVMIVTSLKSLAEVREGNVFTLPRHVTFEPWIKAWLSACTGLHCEGLNVGFWNSVRITLPAVAVSTALGCLNGYALANWRFRGSEFFFVVMLIAIFLPFQVLLFPLVLLTAKMGIFGTPWALIFVHSVFGMPFLTLLFRNYFAALPVELFRAARVDGAGFWSIFFRIMLPMSPPIVSVALVLQVTGIWNDFLFAVTFSSPGSYPMTLQLNNIVKTSMGVTEYNVNMAATILTGLVPLAVYFLSGKLFVRGIAAGALSGT
ncbi:MAG TPA: carbohydrate ABC transporter permease [Bauldia sp.]|nr:carbohydrate ABC transporter permease [Bauldia sp.]